MQQLIVDTDCGVDDAFALLLALSSNRGSVIGITCCFGNTTLDNVCDNVKRVLNICKQPEIPIYRGSSGPLLSVKRRKNTSYHAADGFGNCSSLFPTGSAVLSNIPAVLALIQLASKHPGELTLLALGPLTNIALAHRIDPTFTRNLKSIVCMGGNYKGQGNTSEVAEFNFLCDPEAADIVVGESLCPIQLVPWETCLDFPLKLSLYYKMIEVQTDKGRFFKDISKCLEERAMSRNRDFSTDCDLLVSSAALYPESVVTTIEHTLAVESGGVYCRGLAVLLDDVSVDETGRRKKVQIITGFDIEFLDKLRYQMLQEDVISF